MWIRNSISPTNGTVVFQKVLTYSYAFAKSIDGKKGNYTTNVSFLLKTTHHIYNISASSVKYNVIPAGAIARFSYESILLCPQVAEQLSADCS